MDLYRSVGFQRFQSIWHSVHVAVVSLRETSGYARKLFWIAYETGQQRANVI